MLSRSEANLGLDSKPLAAVGRYNLRRSIPARRKVGGPFQMRPEQSLASPGTDRLISFRSKS
jgi:hypothetical protein